MTIDWQSLLRRYMALNYVPKDGDQFQRNFSGEELSALRAIEADYVAQYRQGKDPEFDDALAEVRAVLNKLARAGGAEAGKG
jgi:predicted metal-dependent peptidase